MFAAEHDGTAVDDGIVEGIAHHQFPFQLVAAHAESVGGFAACFGTVETALATAEAGVGSIGYTRVGIEVETASGGGVDDLWTFESGEGIRPCGSFLSPRCHCRSLDSLGVCR